MFDCKWVYSQFVENEVDNKIFKHFIMIFFFAKHAEVLRMKVALLIIVVLKCMYFYIE